MRTTKLFIKDLNTFSADDLQVMYKYYNCVSVQDLAQKMHKHYRGHMQRAICQTAIFDGSSNNILIDTVGQYFKIPTEYIQAEDSTDACILRQLAKYDLDKLEYRIVKIPNNVKNIVKNIVIINADTPIVKNAEWRNFDQVHHDILDEYDKLGTNTGFAYTRPTVLFLKNTKWSSLINKPVKDYYRPEKPLADNAPSCQTNANDIPDVDNTRCQAVIFDKNFQILLVLENVRPKTQQRWGFPKGRMKIGEDSTQCLYREICEEIGIQLDDYQHFIVNSECGTTKCNKIVYMKESAENINIITGPEIEDYKWVSLEWLLADTIANKSANIYNKPLLEMMTKLTSA